MSHAAHAAASATTIQRTRAAHEEASHTFIQSGDIKQHHILLKSSHLEFMQSLMFFIMYFYYYSAHINPVAEGPPVFQALQPLWMRVQLLFMCLFTMCAARFVSVGSGRSEWDAATLSWISEFCVVGRGIPHISAHHDPKAFQMTVYGKKRQKQKITVDQCERGRSRLHVFSENRRDVSGGRSGALMFRRD